MDNKKLGILLIVMAILILGIFVYYNDDMNQLSIEKDCLTSDECKVIDKNLSFIHVGIGIFSFLLAIGFYLLLFNKTEERIKNLEDEKDKEYEDDKFNFALKFLSQYEGEVLKRVKDEDGITQNMLRLKTNMSKAKLSYVLQDLEKRELIKRVKKGKTLEVYLKI